MFLMENLQTGETLIAQLAWSGGYAFTFDLNREGDRFASLSMDIALDAPAPLRVVEASKSFVSPHVHVGYVFGGLDVAVQQMHEHIRESVFLPPTRGVSGWIEAGIGPEFDMDRDSTLKSIAHASSCGAEIFFIDAGCISRRSRGGWWKCCGELEIQRERISQRLEEFLRRLTPRGFCSHVMDATASVPPALWKEPRLARH